MSTLYREQKKDLRSIAKKEGIRGYGSLNKRNLIDTILYHRRVAKSQIDSLSHLKKMSLRA